MMEEFIEVQKLFIYYTLLSRNLHGTAATFLEETNFQPKPDDVSTLLDWLYKVLEENQSSTSNADSGSCVCSNSPSHDVSSCSNSLLRRDLKPYIFIFPARAYIEKSWSLPDE